MSKFYHKRDWNKLNLKKIIGDKVNKVLTLIVKIVFLYIGKLHKGNFCQTLTVSLVPAREYLPGSFS